jgi:cob(I)alamin adenosyltransferase
VTAMGHVYLYYGTGGGKTAASLGLALRSIGHGHRVVVVQFLKYWKKTGEYKVAKTLAPLYEIKQFGRPGWIKTGKADDDVDIGGFKTNLRHAENEDKTAARKALRYAEKVISSEYPPELIILDEVCLAAHMRIIESSEVIALLNRLPSGIDVVLTGRYTPQALIDRADFVNEVRELKAPKSFVSTIGIQY